LFQPSELTGPVVEEVRTQHKLSRLAFSQLAGFTGKSTARLSNIERNESWKPGDREAVARVLNQLAPNFDPRYHVGAVNVPVQSAEAVPDGYAVDGEGVAWPHGLPIAVELSDDDPEDGLVDVLPAERPTVVEVPLVEVSATTYAVPEGSYPVSNSELQTWKRCRRKWWLAWYRRLALRTETFVGVRAVGDRIHRALERWYVPEGTPRVDPRDALERVIVDDWTRVVELGRQRNVDDEQLTGLAKEFAASTNLERAMIEGYVQWLDETGADAELRVLASEAPLSAPVGDVDVRGEPRPVTLIGKLDVRVKRVTDDVNLFLDHKTVGDLRTPAVTLPQNEQMMHYMLLEFLQSDEGEARCDGALYNMLRRSQRTGRATPPFYDRVEVRHNSYELASYRRRLLGASRDVLQAIDALERGADHLDVVYPSPTPSCKWDCSFFAVCNLLDDGSAGANDMIDVLYKEVDPRARYDIKDVTDA
jgi:hypothetical protein